MPAAAAVLIIGVVVLVPAVFGWLITTFLFAFSGGQYRMVGIVDLGAVVVIALGLVVAAAAWLVRSRTTAIVAGVIATIGGWVAAPIVEWVLSFWFGA